MRTQPEWVRSCADCREFVYGVNGELSTYPGGEIGPDGEREMIPMKLADYGETPPCESCPKIPADAPAKHWDHAYEFEPWVFDCVKWYKRAKAVGRFGDLSRTMEEVAAVVADHVDDVRDRRAGDVMLAGLLKALKATRG